MLTKQGFIQSQLALLKKETQAMINHTRSERFTLEEQVNNLSAQFYTTACDYNSSELGVLMSVCTRHKIHSIVDVALQKIKRNDPSADVSRLHRLIPIHLQQVRRLDLGNYELNKKFYMTLLEAIEAKLRWLNHLLVASR